MCSIALVHGLALPGKSAPLPQDGKEESAAAALVRKANGTTPIQWVSLQRWSDFLLLLQRLKKGEKISRQAEERETNTESVDDETSKRKKKIPARKNKNK
jgi:hypothetical protein